MPEALKRSSLVFSLALSLATATGAADVSQTIHVPSGWEGAYTFGYAPVIRSGDMVIVSGIPAGGPGTYEEKIRRMYERAKELLDAAGATLDDVVELTTFHVEAKDTASFREEFGRYIEVHRSFFGEHRPAWTAVGTSALLAQEAPVEMRIVAVAGSGKNRRVVRDTPPDDPEEGDPSGDGEDGADG